MSLDSHMQYKFGKKMKLSTRKNYQTRSTLSPQNKNVDLMHIGSDNTKTMRPIFENLYLMHYMVKSHNLNNPRKLEKRLLE